ncbi:hypothetical protein BT96DRAFT_977324 [Gymnopus androsaceus JB14]|uniref:JmjC domain-containing protein n=1 Tax=Gymnopus androsaceus JB14 TaxID=1447944 RepID=A0A6A4HIQ7_9AGAR|nr:hypothetical protein BT96DRAFT_977324 [Gymnopus androsaceus JB14]
MERPRKKARYSKPAQEVSNPPIRHVQHTPCSELGKNFPYPLCVSCKRNKSEQCRFKGVRILVKEEDTVVRIEYRSTRVRDLDIDLLFPDVWNMNWTLEMIVHLKRILSKHLIPIMSSERSHCDDSDAVFRPHHSDIHPQCDICNTSLFTGNWLCELCGREVCSECYEDLQTFPRANGGSKSVNLDCHESSVHVGHHFRRTSRFTFPQLNDALKQMLRVSVGWESDQHHWNPLTRTASLPPPPPSLITVDEKTLAAPTSYIAQSSLLYSFGSKSSLAHLISGPTQTRSNSATLPTPLTHPLPTEVSRAPVPRSYSLEVSEIQPRRIRRLTETALTRDMFERQWLLGEPILIERSPSKAPRADWSPSGFRRQYGSIKLELVDSQSYAEREGTVNEFMLDFGRYEGRSGEESWQANIELWQLQEDFPLYFNDCYSALPLPLYVGPNGPMNVAAHFPTLLQAPDLGPMLQLAKASYEHPNTNGTNRMTWSSSDFVDVMVYASPAPNGEPGSAAWDLFRAEDSSELRKFVDRVKAERDSLPGRTKPVEDEGDEEEEGVYLNKHLLDRLWQELKIAPYRVYQRSGESLMVPAECAYQICHIADCINVQLDFVTTQSLERCEKMRRHNRSRKQVDYLHLRWMMWFAWLSCCEQEKRLNNR